MLKLDLVTQAYNPSTREAEAGGWQAAGLAGLQSKFKS